MYEKRLSDLLVQADFGRTMTTRAFLLLAGRYRWVVLALIALLALSHIPLTGAPIPILLALGSCLGYVIVRSLLPTYLEERLHLSHVQFWSAQIGILGVTGLLLLIGRTGDTGSLWILYLPALLVVSFYEQQQRYVIVLLEAAVFAAGAHLVELQHRALPTIVLAFAMIARGVAVILPSILIHYFARVDRTRNQTKHLRDKIMYNLLERILLETDGLALWWEIREACRTAVKASRCELYVYNRERRELRCVEQVVDGGYTLSTTLSIDDDHIAVDAIRSNDVIEVARTNSELSFAVPFHGQLGRDSTPIAVIILHFYTRNIRYIRMERERDVIRSFLTDLLRNLGPICTYAAIHQQFPLPDRFDGPKGQGRHLIHVLDRILETLCNQLGFSFATISLVNNDQQEIQTVRGKNVPEGWVSDSHHRLDSYDIQADVLRAGRIEVISEWDTRFDKEIWTAYNHAELIRVWVPLGTIGTIEAGFYKRERPTIPERLIRVVERYAHDVTIVIKFAQLYDRAHQHAEALAKLHEVGYDLQTGAQMHGETELLDQITTVALNVLDANIVMLFPLNRRTRSYGQAQTFSQSVYAGDLDDQELMAVVNEYTTIVQQIAETQQPYYEPDAQANPLLTFRVVEQEVAGAEPSAKHDNFAAGQNIASFAGVPLVARGELLGVLCASYRARHRFSSQDRQIIELFAQQAAAVIFSDQVVRERERRRIESDLHDLVKSSVRGLIMLSSAATNVLDLDQHRAHQHLHNLRRAAWGILADVNIILNNLSVQEHDGRDFHHLIEEELDRVVCQDWSKIRLDLDDDLPRLPIRFTRTLLCLMREAVINALRHAMADAISVSILCTDERIRLIVRDDGCGFKPEMRPIEGHRGLTIMYERVAEAGGRMTIVSDIGRGTIITIDLPSKEAFSDTNRDLATYTDQDSSDRR